MRLSRIGSFIAAAGLLASLPAWAGQMAPAPPAAPAAPASPAAPSAPAPVRGQVTAVDPAAKTVTVQDRSQVTTVLHLSDATRVLVDGAGALSDLKAGQTVRVTGQTAGATITARAIQVVPAEEAALPAPGGGGNGGGGNGGGGNGGGGGRRGGTPGVVATVTPSLTITLADKTTATVVTDAGTRVTVFHAGSIADVKPQANVSALTSGSGDSVSATLIHVRAAFGGRPGGNGGGNGGNGGGNGGGGAPTPAPAAPATPAPAQ